MGDGIRVGLGLGVLATLACMAGGFGCSGSGADPEPAAGDGASAADPPSPLPSQLQLDGGGGAPDDDATAPAPVDPGFRTMWAVDDANRLVRFTSAAPAAVTTLALTGLPAGERLLGVDSVPPTASSVERPRWSARSVRRARCTGSPSSRSTEVR